MAAGLYSRRMLKWGLAVLAVAFAIIILFLTSIEMVAFDLNFYESEYDKLNITESTGMDDDELMRVTRELLNYLRDERKDLNIIGLVNGESRLVFNEREIAHMVDVKDLFLGGMGLRAISIAGLLISLLLSYWLERKKMVKYLANSFLWGFGFVVFLGIILSILMYQDFTPVWDQFHYIFFSNDLWLLDPNTDILIQMVPEQFFFDTVQRILCFFGGGMIILFIPSLIAKIKRV